MAQDLIFKPFSGVGIITMFERDAVTGLPSGPGFDLGEPGKIDVGNSAPVLEMNTQRSSDRGVAFSMAQSRTGTVAIELRTVDDNIWTLLTGGVYSEQAAAAAVTNWAVPYTVASGQYIKLPHKNVSAVTVKDATSTALVADVGYQLDGAAGTIRLIGDISGVTQPLTVDYTPGAVKVIGANKAPKKDYIVQLNGTNAYDETRGVWEFFKFRFSPDGAISLINTEFGNFQLNGSIQKDETKSANSAGGQYYQLVQPGA